MVSGLADQMPRPSGSGRKRRALLALLDQGLFSFSNFALTVVVARTVTARDFGAFALAIATYLLGTVVLRGLTSETLMVRFSATVAARWRRAAASAGGAALTLSIVFAVGVLLAGVLIKGDVGAGFIAVGIMFPGLALQDFMRFAALALGRPGSALWNDLTQVALQFGLIGWLISTGRHSVWELVVAWGASAYAGASVGCILLRIVPLPTQTIAWFRSHGDLAWRYGVDDLTNQGSTQTTSYVVAFAAGLEDAGAVRGAQTVFGPASVITLGVQGAALPELVRSLQHTPHRFHREIVGVGAALALVAAVWGCAALMLPTGVGESLFGNTWDAARPLLIFLSVAKVADGFRVGPTIGLRSLGAARHTLRARWITTVFGLAFRLLGAAMHGALGVMLANAVTRPLEAAVWWHYYQRARHEQWNSDEGNQRVKDPQPREL